jgi:hypothetical protein
MDERRQQPRRWLSIATGVAVAGLVVAIAARAPFLPLHGTRWDITLWAIQGLFMAAVALLRWRTRRGEVD